MHRDGMNKLGEEERKISENAIGWLLCGQRSFKIMYFLRVVTSDVDLNLQPSKENLLK